MNSKGFEVLRNGYALYPQFLQIEITDYCPLKCPQCYKKDTDYSYMSIEDFQKIVTEAVRLGVESVTLNGGEPLLHKKFCDFVRLCNENHIECTVFTSGYGLDHELCQKLKQLKINIYVSLNGSTYTVDRLSRDGYRFSIEAMRILKEYDIPFHINWVARHDNINDFKKLIDFVKIRGASSINVVCNKLTGPGEIDSPCDYNDYQILRRSIEDHQDFIKVQNCFGLLMAYLGTEHGKNRIYGCQAGVRLMAVSVDGRYMPCTHLYYYEKFPSIEAYWKNSLKLQKLRSVRFLQYCEDCKKCRVCHSISRESYQDLSVGFKKCPLRNHF